MIVSLTGEDGLLFKSCPRRSPRERSSLQQQGMRRSLTGDASASETLQATIRLDLREVLYNLTQRSINVLQKYIRCCPQALYLR